MAAGQLQPRPATAWRLVALAVVLAAGAAILLGSSAAGLGCLALVAVLITASFAQTTGADPRLDLLIELSRCRERVTACPADTAAEVVVTAAAQAFAACDVELILVTPDGPLQYTCDGAGVTRRRVPMTAFDAPWATEALGGAGATVGCDDEERAYCAAGLATGNRARAVVAVRRRRAGDPGFHRRDAARLRLLVGEAAGLFTPFGTSEPSTPESGGANGPTLAALRESAARLERLSDPGSPAPVSDIVDELYAIERTVASLLGGIALSVEPELGFAARMNPGATAPQRGRRITDWTTTGLVDPDAFITKPEELSAPGGVAGPPDADKTAVGAG